MSTASTTSRQQTAQPARLCVLFIALCCLVGPQLLFANTYEEGRKAYITGDYKKALGIIEPLAKDGDSEAQKLLGIMYDYGHGVKEDATEALNWYLLSALQGNPAVQYQVGAKYFRGDGTEQDYKEAAKWWEMAANGGQVDAQFNLGLMYFRGLSIPANDKKAAALFAKSAAQGHGHSQYSLAVMYAFGRGVKKDYATALEWFRKAAKQDIGQAQFNLGVFYENGYGVKKDTALARDWYEKAAAQGVAEATQKLAQLDSAGGAPKTEVKTAVKKDIPDSVPEPGVMSEAPPVTTEAPVATTEAPAVRSEVVQEDWQDDTPAGELRRERWVLKQSPDTYTLQIASVTREQDIVKFIRESRVENEAAYIEVVINGVTRYNALIGVYDSHAEATLAIDDLPADLRAAKPWVRSFRILQRLLQEN